MPKHLTDLAGQRFGKLIVVRLIGINYRGKRLWECSCKCGRVSAVTTENLNRGKVQSCGCFGAEHGHYINRSHGMTYTRTFRVWGSMIQRCQNPKNISYKHYGARGIKVCAEWLTFENFYADMGESVAPLQLDRINNDGNYEPGNCRWVTPTENANNRKRQYTKEQ